MKITQSERDLIQHRLDMPDAIVGATGISEDAVSQACDSIAAKLASGTLETSTCDILERGVLCNAMTMSTYLADIEDAEAFGEITRGEKLAAYRAAASLERKFGVSIPRY